MKIKVFLFLIIIVMAFFLRIYNLDTIPSGLNNDEATQGYNAYSILKTGKDRFGQFMPVTFRSLGSYQPPLYTYLSTIPIFLFGSSITSIRIISVISGMILVLVSFFLLRQTKSFNKDLGLLGALCIAIMPWSVFFSRIAVEANLGVSLFALGVLFSLLSLKNPKFFILAALSFGLSTHAYYSERITTILFLIAFSGFFFRKILLSYKWFIVGTVLYLIIQIPHALLLTSGASLRRLEQVNYWGQDFFQKNGGSLINIPFGREIFSIREFLSQYISYFSPRNLFFDPDPQLVRSLPELSVFYIWMLPFLLLGIYLAIKETADPVLKVLLITLFIGPLPAALTRDPFYTTRTLVFLWALTLIASIGIYFVIKKIPANISKVSILVVIIFSLILLYNSYFVLLKYERTDEYGYAHIKLAEVIKQSGDKKIILDSGRALGADARIAYITKYDPSKFQKDNGEKILKAYYDNVNIDDFIKIGNTEIKPISWAEDFCKGEVMVVGDNLAISEDHIKEHKLITKLTIKDLRNIERLKIFIRDPASCKI